MATEALNILCLDGGGVRGLSSLLILRSLMQQLKMASKMQTEPLPCEVFDLICGTSTGGLTALMLGRLRMSVDDAIESYLQFSRTVFEEKNSWILRELVPKLFGGKERAVYDAAKLEKWMIDVVYKQLGDGQASLEDPEDGTDECCRTFVAAVYEAYPDAPPKIFRTFSTKKHRPDTCKIWEAARATTAASPFFDSATFGIPAQTYSGGSYLGLDNPSQLAIDEIRDMFPSKKIGCFLSLGTGVLDVSANGVDKLTQASTRLIQSCEGIHGAVNRAFHQGDINKHGEPYFRFSVGRGVGEIGIDEWNSAGEMAGITSGYMRGHEQEERAKRCVETMKPKVEGILKKREEEKSLQ